MRLQLDDPEPGSICYVIAPFLCVAFCKDPSSFASQHCLCSLSRNRACFPGWALQHCNSVLPPLTDTSALGQQQVPWMAPLALCLRETCIVGNGCSVWMKRFYIHLLLLDKAVWKIALSHSRRIALSAMQSRRKACRILHSRGISVPSLPHNPGRIQAPAVSA